MPAPFPFTGPNADRGAHTRVRLIRPVDATAFGVDGINRPGVHAKEHASARDGGLAVNFIGAREAEGPLQFEVRHLVGGQARRFGGLEAGIGDVIAPAVPQRLRREVAERGIAGARVRHELGVCDLADVHFPAAKIEGNFAKIRVREALEGCVRAFAEGGIDGLRRKLPKGQDFRRGGWGAWISVASGAMFFKQDSAFGGLGI